MNQNFEHAALEKDIERLAAEVKGMAAAETPEAHKEAIKEKVAKEIYSGGAFPKISSQQTPSQTSSILPDYLQSESQEVKLKIEQLVDTAWHKGINVAVQEAKKIGTFYVDALHDALIDKLYNEFKNRGLL